MAELHTLTLEALLPDRLPDLSTLSLEQETDLKLAIYWLRLYQPPEDGSTLDRVRGYLEACHHLGDLSAWQAAAQLLQLPISATGTAVAFLPHSAQSDDDRQPSSSPVLAEGCDRSLPPIPLHEQLGLWGYHHQQKNLCQQILGKVNSATDYLCLGSLGRATRFLGQLNTALEYYQQQLCLARALGDRQAELPALSGLGAVYARIGHSKIAIHHHQQQLTLARTLQNQRQESIALADLGCAYSSLARYRKAIYYLEQAATVAERFHDPYLNAEILPRLGIISGFGGQYQKAIHYLTKCLAMGDALVFSQRIAVLQNLGQIYDMGLQRYAESAQYLHQALSLCQETEDRVCEALILNSLAVLYTYGFKRPDLAIPLLKQALRYSQTFQDDYLAPVFPANLCNCYVYLGDRTQADWYAMETLAVVTETTAPEARSIVLATLANACWHWGKPFRAIWLVTRSLWILPPWRSANGYLIFRNILMELGALWRRWFP